MRLDTKHEAATHLVEAAQAFKKGDAQGTKAGSGPVDSTGCIALSKCLFLSHRQRLLRATRMRLRSILIW